MALRFTKIAAYLAEHPRSTAEEIATALGATQAEVELRLGQYENTGGVVRGKDLEGDRVLWRLPGSDGGNMRAEGNVAVSAGTGKESLREQVEQAAIWAEQALVSVGLAGTALSDMQVTPPQRQAVAELVVKARATQALFAEAE